MSDGVVPHGHGMAWSIIVGGLVLAAALVMLSRDPATIRALDPVRTADLAVAPEKLAAVLLDKGMDIRGVVATPTGQSMVVSHFARYFRCDLDIADGGATTVRCFPIRAYAPSS